MEKPRFLRRTTFLPQCPGANLPADRRPIRGPLSASFHGFQSKIPRSNKRFRSRSSRRPSGAKIFIDKRKTEMTIALVETPAPNPMSEQDDHRRNAEVKMVPRGGMAVDKGPLSALAERWLRPADQLDYIIRRWMIPVPFEANRLIATDPVVAQTPAGSKPIDAPRLAFEVRQRIIERGSSSHRAISPCKVRDYAAYPRPARCQTI